MIIYQKVNYLLREPSYWQLRSAITIRYDFMTKYYGVDKDSRTLTAKEWCAWDGATMFPDFHWILEASLWHDILHWLIAKGVIPEEENDLIDEELAHIIKELGGPKARGRAKDLILSARSKYVQIATGLANEKLGDTIPLYKLEYGHVERLK